MLKRALCVVLSAAVVFATLPPPAAEAQFGLKRTFRKVVRAPARIITAPIRALPVVGGHFRTAFGVVAAVAVGAVIFGRLPQYERREVARRSKVVVAKDPDQRVSDVFTSKDGKREVTIVAEPMQKASDLKNDPAILVVSDTVVAPGGDQVAKAEAPPATGAVPIGDKATDAGPQTAPPAAKPAADGEVVRISEVPPDTQCRKVTTQLAIRKKKGQEKADETASNTAVFCQTAPGEWKPAST